MMNLSEESTIIRKVVDELYSVEKQMQLDNYAVLFITPRIAAVGYNAIEVDGEKHPLVPCSDLPDTVAIESKGKYEGKEIKFIKMSRS